MNVFRLSRFLRCAALMTSIALAGITAMASEAGLSLSVVSLQQDRDTVRLVMDVRNPVVAKRDGMLIRMTCRTIGGRTVRLHAIATSPPGLATAQDIAAQWDGTEIVTIEGGFPGGATVRVTFDISSAADIASGSCGNVELRGVWGVSRHD